MDRDKVNSIIRHALSGLGGYLIAKGANADAVQGVANSLAPVIGGLVSWGVAQAWSLIEKRIK